MKRISAIAFHEVHLAFKFKGNFLRLVILPLVFSFVIGIATGGMTYTSNSDPRIPVGVVTADDGSQSQVLIIRIDTSTAIRPVLLSEEAAVAGLKSNAIGGILSIPQGFSAQLLAGQSITLNVRLAALDNVGLAVREALQAAAAELERPILAALASTEVAASLQPFEGMTRASYLSTGLELAVNQVSSPPVTVEVQQATALPQQTVIAGYTLSSPGQLVTWVLATLLGAGAGLVHERTTGTLRRLMVMPASKATILTGKILGWLLLGLLQMTILIVFGMVFLRVNWGRSPLALAMVAVSFGLAATALGTFIAAISRTSKQAGGFVTLGTFLLAPLGGCWIPLEITPKAFQSVAQIFPTTWAMRGFTDVIARGQGPSGVLFECVVLLGFTLLFLVLGIWRFRYE